MAKDQALDMEGRVISLKQVREAKIEERRRKYERIVFKNTLGVYCVIDGKGLQAVELVDVSKEGLSFQLPFHSKGLALIKINEKLVFRFYFSQDSFIPICMLVQNQRECIEKGERYIRFGTQIDCTTPSYKVYELFVQFLAKYAESSEEDRGDLQFFFF